jgi:hypothetical protein
MEHSPLYYFLCSVFDTLRVQGPVDYDNCKADKEFIGCKLRWQRRTNKGKREGGTYAYCWILSVNCQPTWFQEQSSSSYMWCKDIKRWFHAWVSWWNGVKRERKKYNKKQKLFIKEGPELQRCLWCPLWIRSWNNRGTLILGHFTRSTPRNDKERSTMGNSYSLLLKIHAEGSSSSLGKVLRSQKQVKSWLESWGFVVVVVGWVGDQI